MNLNKSVIFLIFLCVKIALAFLCLKYHCLSVSRKWINHSRFALVVLFIFNDLSPDSDILSNKSLPVRIFFLINSQWHFL